MTDKLTPAELVAEIQVRARAMLGANIPPEALAAIDLEQFAVGSFFGSGAAMQVLQERGMIRDTP